MGVTFVTLLAEAEARAVEFQKRVFIRMIGLGLGVWQIDKVQESLYVEEFLLAISQCHYKKIAAVDFCWIKPNTDVTVKTTAAGAEVGIMFSHNNPATLLPQEFKDCLIVATYAWDSNSFPGNEFWCGMLTASGDPAAACCSLVPELQNPYINTQMLDNIRVYE